MVKFADVVTIKRTACKKCFTLEYLLPCKLDDEAAKHFVEFGQPLYSLKTSRLLRIDIGNDYKIEGKIGKNSIKLAIPKALDGNDLSNNKIKNKFDIALVEWMSKKLDIEIVI